MGTTKVVFYREKEHQVPLLKWLDSLEIKPRGKCLARLARLEELGHELRRPEADYLRDEIYELRATYRRIQYRMLYFFHGRGLAVVSHGFVKEGPVPNEEVDRAVERKRKFAGSSREHSFEGQN